MKIGKFISNGHIEITFCRAVLMENQGLRDAIETCEECRKLMGVPKANPFFGAQCKY